MTTSPLTFRGVLASETHKLASLTSLRWLAVAVVGLGVLGALVFADHGAASAVSSGASLAASGFALLAGLSVAGEYANGSARTTLTVVPRRSTLFLAKSAAIAATGMVLGLFAGVLGAAATGLLSSEAVAPIVACAVYVACAGLVGLSIGGLTRRVAPTAVTVLVVVFLLPPLTGGLRVGGVWMSDYLLGESGPVLVSGTGDWIVPFVTVLLWVGVPTLAAAVRLRAADA